MPGVLGLAEMCAAGGCSQQRVLVKADLGREV